MPSQRDCPPEECSGGAVGVAAVLDGALGRQVLGGGDGRHHPLHRQERRQVGRVGGDLRQEGMTMDCGSVLNSKLWHYEGGH